MCPSDAQVGDKGCVLYSGEVFYLLRPGAGAEGDAVHRFIDDAFVYNCMYEWRDC